MKWFKCDPDAALTGTRRLSEEQFRAYWIIILLLYSQDGDLDDDPHLMCSELGWNRQRWFRVRSELFALEKIRMKGPGKLTANRVETELNLSENFSKTQSLRAKIGWISRKEKKENANKTNEGSLPGRNANTTTTTSRKEVSIDSRASRGQPRRYLPDNFHPELAGQLEFDRFCDHARANGRLCKDWEAAWRNWQRNAPRFNGGQNGHGRRLEPKDDPRSIRGAFDRLFEALDRDDEAGDPPRAPDLRVVPSRPGE